MLSKARRARLANQVMAARETTWNGPKGPVPITIKRIHTKSARILLPSGEEKVVPVSELNLTGRWKSRAKLEDQVTTRYDLENKNAGKANASAVSRVVKAGTLTVNQTRKAAEMSEENKTQARPDPYPEWREWLNQHPEAKSWEQIAEALFSDTDREILRSIIEKKLAKKQKIDFQSFVAKVTQKIEMDPSFLPDLPIRQVAHDAVEEAVMDVLKTIPGLTIHETNYGSIIRAK